MAARSRSDRGETLIELLVALSVMSVAVVALVGGLGTAIVMSDVHRKQATVGTTLRNWSESIAAAVAGGDYPACGAPSVPDGAPAGYTASIPNVRYWTGAAWSSSCVSDKGLRQLTLRVASDDGRATEQLVIAVRKPCAAANDWCT